MRQIIATKDFSVENGAWHPVPDAAMTIGDAMEGARVGTHYVTHLPMGLGRHPGGRVFGLCVTESSALRQRKIAA